MPIPVNPGTLANPVGYSHGTRGAGELLFVAGQIGWDRHGRMVSADFVDQFARALDNVLQVVEAVEGPVDDVAILDDVALQIADEPSLRNLRRWRHSTAERMRDLLKRTTIEDLLIKP